MNPSTRGSTLPCVPGPPSESKSHRSPPLLIVSVKVPAGNEVVVRFCPWRLTHTIWVIGDEGELSSSYYPTTDLRERSTGSRSVTTTRGPVPAVLKCQTRSWTNLHSVPVSYTPDSPEAFVLRRSPVEERVGAFESGRVLVQDEGEISVSVRKMRIVRMTCSNRGLCVGSVT